SRKYFHYLIDRAQQQFPARTPDSKVKALNYLLPHIQRVPSRIVRDELASEIAQRIGIDSAVLKQELKTAATSRTGKLTAKRGQQQVSPAEKLLLQILTASGKQDPAVRSQIQDTLEAEHLHHGWPTEAIFTALLAA